MATMFLRWGSLAAGLAVALGAFGAHGLREVVTAARLDTFEVGVRYQFYHALALLLLGLLLRDRQPAVWVYAGYCFGAGLVLFCGSLYGLSLQDWWGVSLRWLGPVTPFGGLFFLVGWVLFFRGVKTANFRSKHEH